MALIAYRQPITCPEIEHIRGVNVSLGIIKIMEEREWIRIVGHRDTPGKPALFSTTRKFLDDFNLGSLDELPPLSEILEMKDVQLCSNTQPMPKQVGIPPLKLEGKGEQVVNHEATDHTCPPPVTNTQDI